MGTTYGPMASAVVDGLYIYYDAKNPKSYPGATGLTWYNLVDNRHHAVKGGSQSPGFPSYNADGYFNFSGGTGTLNYSRFSCHLIPPFDSATVEVWWRMTAPVPNATQAPIGAGGPDGNLYSVNPYYIRCFPNSNSMDYSMGCYQPDYNYIHRGQANGNWHQSVISWNRIPGSQGTMSVYYDCFVKPNAGFRTCYGDANITGHSLRIGVRSDIQGFHFFGDIAVVKYYNRALSEAEVRQNFDALRGRFGV